MSQDVIIQRVGEMALQVQEITPPSSYGCMKRKAEQVEKIVFFTSDTYTNNSV